MLHNTGTGSNWNVRAKKVVNTGQNTIVSLKMFEKFFYSEYFVFHAWLGLQRYSRFFLMQVKIFYWSHNFTHPSAYSSFIIGIARCKYRWHRVCSVRKFKKSRPLKLYLDNDHTLSWEGVTPVYHLLTVEEILM